MAYSSSVTADVWCAHVVPCLDASSLAALAATSRAHTSLAIDTFSARIDASLTRNSLDGLIDIERGVLGYLMRCYYSLRRRMSRLLLLVCLALMVVTVAALALRRMASLSLSSLGGLIGLFLPGALVGRFKGISRHQLRRFGYLSRVAYLLEQGDSEWRRIGRVIQLAFTLGLLTMPLLISPECVAALLSTRGAFRQPVVMAL
ncbi:unnamed protein product [Vitrella brassicaformis CCMP3155]|uniref:Uncharacterized protein n=1 Tax=Vitrella brassicaformis (strain CCMP3155) TaxID=1169540 RepID=A0A0G4FZR4_VITBC|nr:unnamed protein product [Vitrella brassicaformis CCMP3155]|mmetsp:Transcript_21048/g.60095  ORF Transcript_21048/g.60095 Transcript_21048/m.60095 type:complete len:203 (+) Transcript_21048:275-883(+)|eukprot:CEM20886.1 unnamed protein product [Vitrella brassicaformis CCMP3155]